MRNNLCLQENKKINDLKSIYQDLKHENKFKNIKEAFLTNLFQDSIQIIKNYIQKIENNTEIKNNINKNIKINNNYSNDNLKTLIKINLLGQLKYQKQKEDEDLNLLYIVFNSIKNKLNEMNEEYILNPLIEVKQHLLYEKFILVNQIFEKDSIITQMKKSSEKLKELSFFQEQKREIYLNYPLGLKNLLIPKKQTKKIIFHKKSKSLIDENKLNKHILKNEELNIKYIKNAIKYFNKKIKIIQNKKYNDCINKGFISKIYNERNKMTYRIKIVNFDSDMSECSSASRNFSFEEYFSNESSSDYEYIKSEENNKIWFSESDFLSHHSEDDELTDLKKKFLKIKNKNHKYKKQISKLQNLIKRMKLHVTKLKNIIRFSQNHYVNTQLLYENKK